MEMEHTHCSESEFIFPPKKATPRRGDSTAQLLNEIRIDNNRNKPEATGCCPLGDGGGGRVGQSGVGWLLAWLVPLADAPLKTEAAYSTRHQVAVAVAVAGAFVRFSCCSCCVPEGCRTFSARPDQVRIVAVNINFNYDSHHPFKAVRRYASWNQLANTAKPNRTEPQKEQQHHLYALLCLCLIGKVCDDHYDGLRIYNR